MPRPETLSLMERLVSFDTVSNKSNLPLIDFVRDTLSGCGADVSIVHDPDRSKASLLATIGDAGRPGIVLSGHTDVVPVADQIWTSDPFTLTRRGNRLIGRGACDMKGFVAVALAAISRLAKLGLDTPVHLALSYDEEVGCLGVHGLIAAIVEKAPPLKLCVVGEPTGMVPAHAHKGKIGGHVSVRGLAAHSALPDRGVNAVEAAAEAIAFMKGMQRQLRAEGPHHPAFDAPDYTTIQCCMISGGTAVNVVPAEASFDFDVRHVPGDDPHAHIDAVKRFVREHVEPDMRAVAPSAGFTWTEVPGCAAFWHEPDSPAVQLALRAAGMSSSLALPFGTEAGYFQAAGIPTVVCGPGHIEDAHRPDESIGLDQLDACETFIDRLLSA